MDIGADGRHREKTAIYKPKSEAWNRSFPMAFRIKKKRKKKKTKQNISFLDI